jgi:starch-binding outer membrane protein, SusD/RagB family
MMKKSIKIFPIVLLLSFFTSCKESFLDVVPDNVATIDNAFTMRTEAEKFLFTCYSYLPNEGDAQDNPAFTAGDEFWFYYPSLIAINGTGIEIGRGNQNKVDPALNYWDGERRGKPLFRGLRDCNIFLDNIDKVIDLDPYMKDKWVAEVKFLKAYYHFYLLRLYGPIPIIERNLPISSSVEQVRVEREPVDKVVDYLVSLLDEAAPNLPLNVSDPFSELGRITRPVALAMKARILVTAASPLFNGNADYKGITNTAGTALWNPTYSPEKWVKAAAACKEAIEVAHAAGHQLYYFKPALLAISDTTKVKMNIRNSVADRWNAELIWGSSNSRARNIQQQAMPRIDPSRIINEQTFGQLAPTMRMAELFYSENGVPITEDKNWDYAARYQLRTGDAAHQYYIKRGYQTAALHFNREPRFYASMAFDGAIWYGHGRYNDKDTWHVEAKAGQTSARREIGRYSVTGYFTKKLVNWNFIIQTGQGLTIEEYPWPIMRLADLYLLYAEAQNEVNGPGEDVYKYVNDIRARAGLKTIAESWSQHSNNPAKHTTKEGMREIIHQERLIELAFEAHRFWDLKRWKKAQEMLNNQIIGWDTEQEEASAYYRPKVLYNQTFALRDYFWPIKERDITVNKNLIQNPGW